MKMNKLRFQSKILCLCVSLLFTGSVWAQQALIRDASGDTRLSDTVFTTSEGGVSVSSSFRLNAAPTSTVTVSIQGLDTTEHTVTPSSFMFTTAQGISGGFNNAQGFTIRPEDDGLADGTVSYDVTFVAEGGGWDGVEATITLINEDDEPGIAWTGTAGNLTSITTSEGSGTQQIRIALTEPPAPSGSVTFSVTVGGDSDEVTINPATLTRTLSGTNTQLIAFTPVNDMMPDGDKAYSIDLTVTSNTATNYPMDRVFSLPGINTDAQTAPEDTTAPTLGSTMLETSTVTLPYSEDLDPRSIPALAAYTLTVTSTPMGETELTLVDVSISGPNVILTLSRAPDDAENLSLTYVVPSTNPIQDLASTPNLAAAFADLVVKATGLSVSIADVTVNEDVGNAEVTVTVAGTSTAPITATVTIADGTATAPGDYGMPLSNLLTIGAGETTAIIAIPITDDMIDEDSEDFTVTLSNLGGGGGLMLTLDNAMATVTITDDDTAGFTVNDGGGVSTSEGSATTDGFTVALDSQPTGDVMVLITGIDASEHTIVTPTLSTLTFSTTNWATAQQVTLRGEDDDVFDGDQTYDLTLMPRGGGYDSITQTVSVTNTDNDTAPDSITLSIDPSSVAETADATTITVTATIDGTVVLPTATDVAVTVGGGTATVTTDYTATPSTLTITIPAETLSATGTFMIDPNTSSDNGDTVMVTGTAPSFTTVNPATLTIFEAGVSVHEDMTTSTEISTATIAEAGSDILYVQLASQPADDVILSVTSSDENEGMVSPATLTFTTMNWDTRQAVTVNAVSDQIDRDDSFTVDFEIATAADGDGVNYTDSLVLPSVTVTVTDDDTAGLTVDIGDGVTTSEGATPDSFTVVLDTQPTDTVTVEITGLDATEHRLASSTTLTFTTTNWFTVQRVALTGEPDTDVDGDQTYSLTLTPTGGGYDSVMAETISVTNEDDDTAALTIADMTVDENAGTATVTVTLTPALTATGNVTVDAMTADGTATSTDYTAITSQTLTFAAGTTSQTLSITINDDNIAEGDETFTVMLSNLMTPATVSTVSITDATATVTITDNDTVGFTVVDGGGVTTSEGSATPGTFSVVLDTQPTDTVTVTITGLDATEHSLAPSDTLMFTTTNWSTAQTVMLTGENDDDVDGDQTYSLTLTPTGGGYTGVAAQTVSVTNTDTDTAELTIADMSVDENAGTATVTVTVTLTPALTATGDVTVDVATTDGTATAGTDYTAITSQTLTFAAGTTSQTLDITISDDNIAEGDETFTVTLSNLMTPATVNTVTITDATATVTITDNETAPTAITLSISQPTIPETADSTSITVTATLDGTAALPTQTDITVSVGESGDSAVEGTDYATVADFTLTIPAGMTSAMGTFMIDPNTSSTNGDMVTIDGTSGSFTVNSATLTIIEAGISVHDAMTLGNPISTAMIDETSGSDILYVQLASQPAGNVTLSVASSAIGEGTVMPATLPFTTANWDTRQAVTVNAVSDQIDRDDSFMVNFAVMSGDSGNYPDSLVLPSVTVTVTDDDTAGLTVVDGGGVTTSETGTTGTFTVVLDTQPTDTVTVTISGLDGTEHAFPPLFGTTLTFTTTNWSTAQTVMLTGVDDDDVDGDQTYSLTLTPTGGGYTGVTAPTVSVTNEDDDTAALTIADMTVDENAGTATVTVTLTPALTATGNVTVDAMTADGTATSTDYTAITSQTLTFAAGTTSQTLSITINDDNIAEGDETFTVMLSNLMTPATVSTVSITDATATVTITDNDTVGFTVVDGGGVTTSEGSATPGTFSVVLDTQPTDTVTVTITGLDATEHSLAPSDTLMFTTTNWSTAQTVMLTGENDDDVDGDQTYSLTLTPTGGGYTGVAAQTVSVTNTDTDTAELTIADMSVDENAGTATVTVTVTLTPALTATGDVTVDVATTDGTATAGTDYTAITSQTLTFAAGTTSQTLDITISDDNIAEGDETFTVTLSNLMTPATVNTVTITDATATVTITDNETAPTAITLSISQPTIPETADSTSITVTATLDGTAALPTQTDITVSVGESGDSAVEGTDYATVADFTLTIPAGMTSAMGTFMIDPNTSSTNGDMVTIDGTSGSFTVNSATLTIIEAGISVHDAMTLGNPISTAMIDETSGSDILYVQLASQPAGNVTLSVASSAIGEGTVMPATLPFTTANWDTRQAVTVNAVSDQIDRDDSFMVNFAVMSGDSGNYPDSLVLPSVTVTVTDDDTAGLTVVDGGGVTTSETGTTGTFTVVLDTQPTDTVTVTISGLDGTEHAFPPLFGTTLTFTTTNWFTVQRVALTGEPDTDVDGDQTYSLTLTPTGGGYDSVMAETISVTNEDDDTAALTIADMTVDENAGTATVTVTLTPALTATGNVTVDAMTADGTATSTDYTAITSQTLTFAAGTTSQTLSITINDDNIAEGDETFTVMLSNLMTPATVSTVSITDATATVTITDNDTVGFTVVDGGGVTTSEGSATPGTFSVVLDTQPTDTVTVTITGLDATEHSLAPSDTLMFTTTNWSTAQTVMLTGENDDDVDGDQTYSLTLTPTGGGYTGVAAQTVSVTNTDTDTAELTIADMSVDENAGTATVTVTVTLTPALTATGDVTVDVATTDGTATAGTDYTAITSQTLTFAAGTTSQTLDITISDDNIAEGDETFTVTLSNLMTPATVNTVTITDATATVTITDNETAPTAITLSVSPSTVAETASATTITVTATIDGTVVLPTATDVAVTVSDGTATGGGTDYTATPTTLTITIPALAASATQTFMITPVDDTTTEGEETVTISGMAGSFTVNATTLTIVEAGILVFDAMMDGSQISTVTIAEADSDILYVQLASQPAANVVIGVASSTGEGTVMPATLTFTTGDWDTRQAVTVNAVSDQIDRDDTFTVNFAVTTGDSGNYTNSLTLPSVAVTVTDDDTVGLTVDIGGGVTTSETGTTDTFTVVLDTQPTDTVTVEITGLDATEHSLAPSTTLTFTTTNWATAQTVTLTGANDFAVDGNQMYDLTLTPTGGGYDSVTAQTVSVTNEDDNDTATLSIADMMVDENAGTATLTVTLTPAVTATGDITVDVTTADGTAEAGTDYTAITSQTLTFTAGSTSETLSITISDDNIAEGEETFTVMLGTVTAPTGVTIATADPATVTITDDETAPTAITLSISQLTIPETASATTITVTATIDGTAVLPTATDVAVSVGGGTATVTTDYTATPSTLTITIPALAASATQTFMIDPNTSSDNGDTVMITGTAPSFTTVNPATLTIVEAGILAFDAMTAGNQISTATIAEASGTDTLYVQLASQPAGNVTLSVTSDDTNEGTVTPPTLMFSTTNWDTRQALTVTAVPDGIVRDDTFTVDFAVTTGDGGNYTTSLDLSSVTVTITDDDTAGIALFDATTGNTPVTTITTGEPDTATTFYVELTSEPTASVTVAVASDTTEEGQVTTGASLTFTTTNWNMRQAVTVTGVDDNDVDGDQTYTVTLSSTSTDTNYNALTDTTVTATNTDDDTAALSIADMMVNEDAGTATVTVTLSAMVTTGDVTVQATTADGTAEAGTDYTAITSQTLTFTAGSTTQTLDITISDDDIDEVDETFTVMLDALMTPPGVTTVSITDATATVTITDDEITPTAITLSVNPSTVAETASATTITVTATLDGTAVLTTPTDVAVTVGGGTATVTADYTATPSTLTITIPALASSGTDTFMITPVDDSVDDSGDTVMITGTAGGFTTVNPAILTIVEAGILVYDAMSAGTEISTATIAEASSDILYVQLASQPAGNVTLSVTSDDTNEGTVTPSTLTFSTTNWATRQALTVTAVNDNIDRDGDSFMVDFMITSGDSANYTSSLALPSVAVTVTDDDTASDTINLSVSPDRVTETAGATTITVTATIDGTVVLPTATDVAVTINDGTATGGDIDYTATPTTLTITIPAEATSGEGEFSITPEADDVNDNDETVLIDGTATINGTMATVNEATLRIIEFSDEDQQAIEQTVAAAASGVTQVVTEQIGIRLAKRTSAGSAQDRQSLSSIDWQDRLAKFTYEGLQRLDSEADMPLDWLLQAAGGDGQLLMPLGVESLTLWATGGHISTKGDGVADYDGDVNSFILGVDNELANDWLAGVAISYSDSEIDYTMNGSGETEQTLYGVHPYMSRNISEALTLWFTVGYGFGDIDFSHTSHGRATSDVTQWMAAGGLEQQIITNTPWQGALRIKGLWGNAEVDAATYDRGATIAKVDSDFWRARIESEMGYNFPLLDGNVRPYAIVGGRWDHNDAIVSGDEWHIDIGGGVEFSDNAFALDISVRTQITEGDTEEDSIFATGSLTYDLEQDGQGLQIALSRPLNNTSPAWDSHSFNEVTDTASGLSGAPLTSELAYGWTVRPFGLEGALQTYIQNSFESSDRHYAVGLELAVNALTLSFETGYHDHAGLVDSETDNTGLESMFKTKIKW